MPFRTVPAALPRSRMNTSRHANPSITSMYLRGIDSTEIIHTVHVAPMIAARSGLRTTFF
jgi:hypothetical protein